MSEQDWRSKFLTGREQFHYVFQKGNFSDVRITIEESSSSSPKEIILSHSLVLKIRSSVFQKLLEKIPSKDGFCELTIHGFPADAVRAFIQFLYTDELKIKAGGQGHELIQILYLAKRYKISALVLKCTYELKSKLSSQNASSIFQAARELNEIELGDEALKFILNHASQVFEDQDFIKLNQQNLNELLQDDNLDIQEIELFHNVLRWARVECTRHKLQPDTPRNIRLVLKESLNSIRFPLMKKSEFNEKVIPSGFLNEREITELTRYYDADTENKQFVLPASFSAKLRMSITSEDEIDLTKVDEESHKRLAKLAVSNSRQQQPNKDETSAGGSMTLTVSNVIVEVEPLNDNVNLEELAQEIFKLRKFGLYWGAKNITAERRLLLSFAADERRSYGVGSVIEDIQDRFPDSTKMTYARSFKDDIQVHLY